MWSKQCVPIQILASFGTSFCLTVDFSYEKKSSCIRKKHGKKPQGFVDVSNKWRCWSTPRLAANNFFQPVAILFSTSNASWLYRNHGTRENPLFTAQLMLNFSRSKLWRSNAIIIFSTTNTVFLDYRSHLLMNKKITILPQTESSKGKKKEKQKKIAWRKGRKKPQGFVCFLSRYWWTFSRCKCVFDRQNFLPNIFSMTANFTSLHCSNYHDVQKITILPQTESRKGKEKKTDLSLPHWARSLFILRTPDS